MVFLLLLIGLTGTSTLFSNDAQTDNRPTLVQILSLEKLFFNVLTHKETYALSLTCKGCYTYAQRKLSEPFDIDDTHFIVTIDPNSVIFNKATKEWIGYSINKIEKPYDPKLGSPSYLEDSCFYRYYTFNLHTYKVLSSELRCSIKIQKSITTANRALSLIIPSEEDFGCKTNGITGVIRGWLTNLKSINDFTIKSFQADENTITCTGHGTNNDNEHHSQCIIARKGTDIDIQFS